MSQYDRITKMLGYTNLKKLRKAKVAVIGLGGVGGMALEMLVRSGVCNLYIFDNDIFEISNLNRQILCLNDNINYFKVDVADKRIQNINDNCKVDKYYCNVDEEFLEEQMPLDIEYIIDACDDVDAKVAIVKFAKKNNIKLISACGTGNKLHPEMLKVMNLWDTEYDRLARTFRQKLRKEHLDNYQVLVVSSNEQPLIRDFVGSISTVPNMAGILLSSYVINDIINNNQKEKKKK